MGIRKTVLGLGVVLSLLLAGSAYGATGYVVESDGTLNSVNPETGQTTMVGTAGSDIIALALAEDGTLYAVQGFFPARLVKVNTLTGAITPVGTDLGIDEGLDLAFMPDGSLMLTGLVESQPGLYTVDLVTGAATLVGEGLDDLVYGLEADCSGALFGVAEATTLELVRIDPVTAEITPVGPFGSAAPGDFGFILAFDNAAGQLYAVVGQSKNLYTVNRATGAATKGLSFGSLTDAYNLTLDSKAACPPPPPVGGTGPQPPVTLPPPAAPADTDPPTVKIIRRPPNLSDSPKATYRFRADEAGVTFECKLDRKPWRRCRSPKRLFGLQPGSHRFKVRATDQAGNKGKAAADTFKVKA